jgi:hypothetical protein
MALGRSPIAVQGKQVWLCYKDRMYTEANDGTHFNF